jgi:endonuclease-3
MTRAPKKRHVTNRRSSVTAGPAADLVEKTAVVIHILRDEYGVGAPDKTAHPTDSLVATILSQHTTDRNSHAAFLALKQRYASWADLVEADRTELAATIRCAGLANIKAVRIQRTLAEIEARRGTMDLEFLKTMRMNEAVAFLESLPGVGPKTAACVLLFSCGLPALPVDTHVHRVAGRLGLIAAGVNAEKAHRVLTELVQPADAYDFHVNLIRHGRQVCVARSPRCGVCVLQGVCDFFRRA